MQPFYLDHLSLIDLRELEFVELAAQLGCAGVSLIVAGAPINPDLNLVDDHPARREVIRVLREHRMGVGIVEPFMLTATPDWPLMERIISVAAELGGMVNALGFDTDDARLQDSLGRLSNMADATGVRMCIEAFPLSHIRTQAQALNFARGAGPRVGLCVDTLHVMRAGGSWQDVQQLPSELIYHVQLNDGPRAAPQDRLAEAVGERLPPGEGEFDLPALLPLLPNTASWAIEAPFHAPADMTPLERGRRLVNATRRLLDAHIP